MKYALSLLSALAFASLSFASDADAAAALALAKAQRERLDSLELRVAALEAKSGIVATAVPVRSAPRTMTVTRMVPKCEIDPVTGFQRCRQVAETVEVPVSGSFGADGTCGCEMAGCVAYADGSCSCGMSAGSFGRSGFAGGTYTTSSAVFDSGSMTVVRGRQPLRDAVRALFGR